VQGIPSAKSCACLALMRRNEQISALRGCVAETSFGLPRKAFLMLRKPLLWAYAAALFCACCRTDSNTKQVTVTFDYDFTQNHACSETVTTNCLAQFNVYDISGIIPKKLSSIPAPSGATGPVSNITATVRPLRSRSGKRVFAVSAQMASGEESSPQACAASVAP
jgi:hypothetical protein